MYEQRMERVLLALEGAGLRQMIVSDPNSICYLTGIMLKPMERLFALYLNTNGKHVLFLNNMFVLKNNTGIREVWMDDTDDCLALVAQNVDASLDMGIDKQWPSRFTLGLMEKNPGVRYVTCYAVDRVRMIKDEQEIALMRKASHIGDTCMDLLSQFFTAGVSELDASDHMGLLCKQQGVARSGSSSLVCFGANAADPHHHADQTRLKSGDCILIDTGCVVERYLSDMTRTYYYQSVTPKEREIYQIVLEANLLAQRLIRPGVRLCDLDRAARDHIEKAGYGQYFTHRLGHFIGTECHEYGDVNRINTDVAQAGMIFSIEPGIYLPGETGVRIEDLVLVTPDGCEVLNQCNKQLTILA